MNNIKVLWGGLVAGVLISVGGIIYLSSSNKVVGSLLFSVGLLAILSQGVLLFTGKVGYALGKPASYIGYLTLIWIGNFIGTAGVALIVRFSRIGTIEIIEKAEKLWAVKSSDSLISVFFLAFFCGMLMFIAVDAHKHYKNDTGKIVLVIICVMVFILCSFEHCVANMFYGTLAMAWTPKTIFYLVVMTFGNAAGGLFLPVSKKYFTAKEYT